MSTLKPHALYASLFLGQCELKYPNSKVSETKPHSECSVWDLINAAVGVLGPSGLRKPRSFTGTLENVWEASSGS